LGGFRCAAIFKGDAGLHFKRLRFEPPRSQLAAQPRLTLEMDLHGVVFAKLVAGIYIQILGEQFGAGLADQDCGPHRGAGIVARLSRFIEIDATEPNHRAVGHFDAAESVLLAERNAATEEFECTAHLALRIRCVRKPTERARLCFRRARVLCKAEATLVLLAATVDVAKRKENIALR
jgi:hypothetical protein